VVVFRHQLLYLRVKNPGTLRTEDILEAVAKRMRPIPGNHFTDRTVGLISWDKVNANVTDHRAIKARVE
jgi:hypothetical protein